MESLGGELLGGFQCLDRIGQQVFRVGMNLQLEEVGMENFTREVGCEYCLFGVAHT